MRWLKQHSIYLRNLTELKIILALLKVDISYSDILLVSPLKQMGSVINLISQG